MAVEWKTLHGHGGGGARSSPFLAMPPGISILPCATLHASTSP